MATTKKTLSTKKETKSSNKKATSAEIETKKNSKKTIDSPVKKLHVAGIAGPVGTMGGNLAIIAKALNANAEVLEDVLKEIKSIKKKLKQLENEMKKD